MYLKAINWAYLLFLFTILIPDTHSLYEDQIGKFDWHQKYIGSVRFLANDPNQPKRILVGAENNVFAAVHGNTGAILYRHILEGSGDLILMAPFVERTALVISSQNNYLKIRTFLASTGVRQEEWLLKADATHATIWNDKIYVFNIQANLVTISVVNFEQQTLAETKQVKVSGARCDVTGRFIVCLEKGALSIVNFVDGSVSSKKIDEDITSLGTSGIGEIPAVVLRGNAIQVFFLLENSKSGPEMMPLKSYTKPVSLSQFKSDSQNLLVVTQVDSANRLIVETFNTDSKLDQQTQIKTDIPANLILTKGYILNNRIGLVGFTRDCVLLGLGTLDGSNIWTRQEALSQVVATEMVDFYPSELGPTWNPYSSSVNVYTAFLSRVKYEMQAIVSGETFYSSADDRFGLKKIVVFVTSIGKIIGMDSATGDIFYTFMLEGFTPGQVSLYVQRPSKYIPLQPEMAVVFKRGTNTVLVSFNPVEGKLREEVSFGNILQIQMLNTASEETKFIKPILLLDRELRVHTYPSYDGDIKNCFFLVAQDTQLRGYAVKKVAKSTYSAKSVWELKLEGSSILGVYGKQLGERVHSQGRVLIDRSVSYKYVNPNLVVVVTAESDNINIYLVDAVSGAVVHSFWHKKCRGPVNVVHSEHWLVYSLFNEKNRRIELSSIELYEGTTQSNSTAFSSFAAPVVSPIVVKQSFIFPMGIQSLSYTRTEKGITNKDILIGLPSGGVVELPRLIVQPRLSQQHYTQQIQDEDGVIHSLPYIPELPVPPDMIINYNQTVRRIDGIRTWPTRLESTCLVLVYGSDLFYTRVTPSKTFDVLKDDFDHWFITVVLFGLCLCTYLTKRLSARKTLEQAWK